MQFTRLSRSSQLWETCLAFSETAASNTSCQQTPLAHMSNTSCLSNLCTAPLQCTAHSTLPQGHLSAHMRFLHRTAHLPRHTQVLGARARTCDPLRVDVVHSWAPRNELHKSECRAPLWQLPDLTAFPDVQLVGGVAALLFIARRLEPVWGSREFLS